MGGGRSSELKSGISILLDGKLDKSRRRRPAKSLGRPFGAPSDGGGTEMANMKALLSDVSYVRLSLAESTGDTVKVRGEFAKCGIATENKRVYPKQVWEKEIKRLNKSLQERRVLGEVDHPSDGQTKLARVSHIVTGLKVEDGLVVGEAEIMPTEQGKHLLALLKSNIPIGVSSRGFGSVKTNESGQDVVQEDYKLVTFDFVADPADVDAYPTVQESRQLFEGVQFDVDDEQDKAIEWARRIEAEKTGVKTVGQDTLRDEFARDILNNLAGLRAEAMEQAKQALMQDPAVAGARRVMDQIKAVLQPYMVPVDAEAVVLERDEKIAALQEQLTAKDARIAELEGAGEGALTAVKTQLEARDARIAELEQENTALAGMAKEVGYRYFLERELSNDAHAAVIRKLVGDVKKYDSSDELKARMEAIRAEISKQQEVRQEEAAEQARVVAEAQEKEEALRDEFDVRLAKIEKLIAAERQQRAALEQELETAQEENKELRTKLYAESRIASHPKAAKIRNLVESTRVSSRADIDSILEAEREPVRDADDLQDVRARIRSRMRSEAPQEAVTEARQMVKNDTAKDYLGLGIDLGRLKHLSGI